MHRVIMFEKLLVILEGNILTFCSCDKSQLPVAHTSHRRVAHRCIKVLTLVGRFQRDPPNIHEEYMEKAKIGSWGAELLWYHIV